MKYVFLTTLILLGTNQSVEARNSKEKVLMIDVPAGFDNRDYIHSNRDNENTNRDHLAQAQKNIPNTRTLDYEDQSINDASVWVDKQGLFLKIEDSLPNDNKNYYGPYYGNKSILGINNYNDTLVSKFLSFSFKRKALVVGSNPDSIVYVEVVVDLNCDKEKLVILTSDIQISKPSYDDDLTDFTYYQIGLTDRVWRNKNRIVASNGQVVIPNEQDSYFESLLNLVSYYPSSCFVKADTKLDGMPKNMETSSLMLVVGKDNVLQESEVWVKDVMINWKRVKASLLSGGND